MDPLRSLPLLVEVTDTMAEAGGVIQYLLVFAFAAFPWVEIAIVIPIAIGLDLDPVLVGVVAFAGNVGSVYVLLAFHQRIARWRARRQDEPDDATVEPSNRRTLWAKRLWDRYGLPGIALAAPALTGVHLAALIALAAGSRRRAVAGWMTVGIAAWTVALVAGSMLGLSLLGG